MATDMLSQALGTTPSLVRGFGAKTGMKERADFGRQNIAETFERGAEAEAEAAKTQFDIQQSEIGRTAQAERDLATGSAREAQALEQGTEGYKEFEIPQIKASDYAANASLRLLSSLLLGGVGGASGRAQLMAIKEMQDAEDKNQRQTFAAAKLKFDEADRKRKDSNDMLKQRFDRMLNLLSKNRNAALVEAKLIEGKMGDGLIAAQLRKGNYQKAYELFSKAIESQDKADAELAKQQAIFAEKKALKQTPGAGGGKGGGKVKISDIPSDMRADLKKAGDAVYNLNNITSTLSNEHLMIAPSASVADAILLAIERGGDVAQLAKNLTGKDIKPETVNWWKSYREYISKVRNQLYGATLTSNEQADFERFIVTPATDRQTALQYFENQKRTLRNAVERKVKETQAALEAETAEDLVRGVAGITSSPQGAGGPRVPTVNTPAEYDALPPGAEFIDAQDGKRYKKPKAPAAR